MNKVVKGVALASACISKSNFGINRGTNGNASRHI